MAVRITDVSDLTPTEIAAFDGYVRQSLGFVNATEEQAARTVVLPAIYSAAARTTRDRRQLIGSTR